MFRKIRAGDFTFHQSQWKNVSSEAKCLIARLLTVNPEYRCTAKQALQSNWIQNMDAEVLRSNNLSESLTVLKTFNGRMTLKARAEYCNQIGVMNGNVLDLVFFKILIVD
jgi:calcium-dependent protein kinase